MSTATSHPDTLHYSIAIENSEQRHRWMTQAKRSQCEWSVIQLREQSFNCFDCQSMYIVWDTKHIHFFSDNKIYNIVQPKALPWQMRYKLSGTNDHDWPPAPHESTSEICVCAGENGGGVEMSSCNYLYHKTVSKMIMSVQKTQDVN